MDDLYFKIADLPRQIKCGADDCMGQMEQSYDSHNLINFYAGPMYGGEVHPQFGVVVESYAHMQQLCKQYGVEGSMEGERHVEAEEAQHESWKEKQGMGGTQNIGEGDIIWGDREELTKRTGMDSRNAQFIQE